MHNKLSFFLRHLYFCKIYLLLNFINLQYKSHSSSDVVMPYWDACHKLYMKIDFSCWGRPLLHHLNTQCRYQLKHEYKLKQEFPPIMHIHWKPWWLHNTWPHGIVRKSDWKPLHFQSSSLNVLPLQGEINAVTLKVTNPKIFFTLRS
jgi:hypothetical protein